MVGSLAGTAAVAIAVGLALAHRVGPLAALALVPPFALAAAAHDVRTLGRKLFGERPARMVSKPPAAAPAGHREAELIGSIRSTV